MSSIEIKGDGDSLSFIGKVPAAAIHLVRRAIDDIGDKIEEEAKVQAPLGDSGELKAHPVDRTDTVIGKVTGIPSIGGGLTARGAGGRFVAGGQSGVGRIIARSEMTVASEPKHAIWVHNGTGIYGRFHHPIVARRPNGFMVFNIDGRKFIRRSVRGQIAQPFLQDAYVIINDSYVPLRVERLRLEIKQIT